MTKIVEEIKTELEERIFYSKWMNDNTKEFMIDKMDNLLLQIGYPEWYNNQTALIEHHEGVEYSMYIIGNKIKKTYNNKK